jgi:prophage antirepressor-like protein
MNAVAMQSFGFGDQLVRVVERDEAAWFVANDVCAAIEVSNPRDAVRRLDEDEKGVVTADTLGGPQDITVINESGVYALIFRSRKPAARAFRKWVTGEVLPAIRRTGKYEPTPANDPERAFEVPELGTKDDRDALRVATLIVRECKDLYGQQAGREMWQKLGFPVPGVDLAPAPAGPGEAPVQMEGDLHQWFAVAGVAPSRREATSLGDLYESYTRFCSDTQNRPMEAERFRRGMKLLFGTEEHPEMIRAALRRR